MKSSFVIHPLFVHNKDKQFLNAHGLLYFPTTTNNSMCIPAALAHVNMVTRSLITLHPGKDCSLSEANVLLDKTHQEISDSSAFNTCEEQIPTFVCKNLHLNGSMQNVAFESFPPVALIKRKSSHEDF